MKVLGQIRRAAGGVPAIMRAGRQAGLTDAEARELVAASALITLIAMSRHPRAPWQQNAVRHFAWQAWLTARHGSTVAMMVATAHERRSADALDHQVDLRNNDEARTYALATDNLDVRPMRRAVWQLVDVAEKKWRRGELWTGKGGRVRRQRPQL